MGPLIDDRAVAEDGGARGRCRWRRAARSLVGGKRSSLGGTFFEPTVMTGITQAMKLAEGGDLRAARADHARSRTRPR